MKNKKEKFELDEKEHAQLKNNLKDFGFKIISPERMSEIFIFDYKDYLKTKKAKLKLEISDSGSFLSYQKRGDDENSKMLDYIAEVKGPIKEIILEIGYQLVSSYQKKEIVWKLDDDQVKVKLYPFTCMIELSSENLDKLIKKLDLDTKKSTLLEIDDIFNDRFGYEKQTRF